MISKNKIFACSSGSALKDVGVIEFFHKLDQLTETDYSDQKNFAGQVFKIRYDESENRVTFLKSLSGTLSVRDEVGLMELKKTESRRK